MKNKSLLIFHLLLVSIVTLACSLFTGNSQGAQTEEPEPEFEPITDPLVIDPDSLPDAKIGGKYEVLIRITQNVTPVGEMFISEGVLPPGLELVFMEGEDSAVISGVPTEAGTYSFTLSAWCFGTQVNGQTLDKEYTIVVGE